MEFIATVLVTIATAISSLFGAAPQFGSTITTILGTDRLSDSRTTINDNFASLNTSKIEVGSTSIAAITTLSNLSSIGTIGTGIWNGTAIGVAYGGTGTTSPTSNAIMFGDGASGLKVIGYGNSGQFLTSQGFGAAPIFTSPSLDTTIDYNFTGSYFGVKNLVASSTAANPVTLNTLSYNTPSTRAASSTVLSEDGNGNLSWNPQDWQLLAATTSTAALATATSTFSSASQDLRIIISSPNTTTGSATNYNVLFNGDGGANYAYLYSSFIGGATDSSNLTAQSQMSLIGQGTGTTSPVYIILDIKNVASKAKVVSWRTTAYSSATAPPQTLFGSGLWNNTSAGISSIQVRLGAGAGAQGNMPAGMSIQVYGSRN